MVIMFSVIFFFVLQVFSTAADIKRTMPLPESPRLIILCSVFFLSVPISLTCGYVYVEGNRKNMHLKCQKNNKLYSYLCLGDVLTATNWMQSIESQVVVVPHQNFVAGLAVFFSWYYIFNLVYQEKASSTLEFIQRYVLEGDASGLLFCYIFHYD